MSLLAACSGPQAPVTPANSRVACPAPRVFDGETADDLVTEYLDLMSLYRECAARHRVATQ